MEELSTEKFKELLSETVGPCISIYLPVVHVGSELQQNSIRIKNLVRQVESQLAAEFDPNSAETGDLVTPIRELDREGFWDHPGHGLAIFRSLNRFEYYWLDYPVDEIALVGDRFHLKPLLPLTQPEERFFVLALSMNEVRLIQASRFGVREVPLPEDFPTNMTEAPGYQKPERQLQHRNATPGATGPAASPQQAGVFHGQGAGIDDKKEDILQFCYAVDKSLHGLMRYQHAPLVVAAVQYLIPIYRQANTYSHLIEEGINGSPELIKAEELAQQARPLVQPIFEAKRQQAMEHYYQKAGTGLTSTDLGEAVSGAYFGRVDTLFVARGQQQFGTFNTETGEIEAHPEEQPGDDDLIDIAATQTVLNGGKVYMVEPNEVPEEAQLAAVMRY